MFDVQAWVDDPLFAFSDEEKTEQLARFSTDARRKALEGNQLRLSDYSRKMNTLNEEMAAKVAEHEAADAKLNRELAEWATVQGTSAEKVAAADARIVALEQQKLAARQSIERMAQAQGVDAAPYLEGLETIPAVTPAAMPPAGTTTPATPEPPDMSGFVKTTDAATMNKFLFEFQTAVPMLQSEHLALTGEALDTVALGAEIQRRAAAGESLNPRETWETLHDIPAKRQVAATTKYDADIAAAVERGRQAQASEAAIPGGTPAGTRAVVFQPRTNPDGTPGEPHKSALERPQLRTRMDGAVQALAAGTYRTAPREGAPVTGTGAA